MGCYHPVDVPIRRKFEKYPGVNDVQTVPCGTCLGCRAEQARQWTVRILHEKRMHEASSFLTLTYREEDLPENGSLYSKDLQRFFKALRRREAQPISYYACAEYGEATRRPHYHAVLFGPAFLDRSPLRDGVWRSGIMEECWPLGISEFGQVTEASAAYVAGYVRKKVSRKVNPDAYTRVDPETGELVEISPEFSRMSLKPAIGKRWIEEFWKDVYPKDRVVIGGWEGKPPRFYDKWMDENQPRIMMEVREKRYAEAIEKTKYTLAAQEKIHRSRVGLFQGRDKV